MSICEVIMNITNEEVTEFINILKDCKKVKSFDQDGSVKTIEECEDVYSSR